MMTWLRRGGVITWMSDGVVERWRGGIKIVVIIYYSYRELYISCNTLVSDVFYIVNA